MVASMNGKPTEMSTKVIGYWNDGPCSKKEQVLAQEELLISSRIRSHKYKVGVHLKGLNILKSSR